MSSGSQLSIGSAQRVGLETTDGPVAALCAGDPGATAVLLVPGYTGSKEDFGPLLDPLAAAGFRVTAIDLPGQFESPGPDDPTGYTPDLLGASVHEVASSLGAPVHLVGHSFGGLVARAAAIADPRPFASLVLMNSGPAALGGQRSALIKQLAPLLASSGIAAVYAASQAVETAQPGYVAPPTALAEFLKRRFLAGAPAMLHGMGDALCCEPDRVADLAATGVATLVLYGSGDDAWLPDLQDEMALRLGADRVVIAAAAHSPAIENTAETATALIAFWRRHPPGVTLGG